MSNNQQVLTSQVVEEIRTMATLTEAVRNLQITVQSLQSTVATFNEKYLTKEVYDKDEAKREKRDRKVDNIEKYFFALVVTSQVVLWIINKFGEKIFPGAF